ncbi:hypothetical protein ACFFIO_07110 [Citricoccus parietis]|uniref:DUF222 domain-containing protein n=1 Tax=Citricoccus parietis TaxID=592307 RepID=A0ABV6F4C6_9MICC
MIVDHRDLAVAALAEVLIAADSEAIWTRAVFAAYPDANGSRLAHMLRWAPVSTKRHIGVTLADDVLTRSPDGFLALAGEALAVASQYTHPVWAELAAPGINQSEPGNGPSAP